MAFHLKWKKRLTKLKFLSAPLIAAAMLVAPAMARESHVTSRHRTETPMRVPHPACIIFEKMVCMADPAGTRAAI